MQNTKQEQTDLLQDNSSQLNEPKLETVHTTISAPFHSVAAWLELHVREIYHRYVSVATSAAYNGSQSVISQGNRRENSISDFRLQSEIFFVYSMSYFSSSALRFIVAVDVVKYLR